MTASVLDGDGQGPDRQAAPRHAGAGAARGAAAGLGATLAMTGVMWAFRAAGGGWRQSPQVVLERAGRVLGRTHVAGMASATPAWLPAHVAMGMSLGAAYGAAAARTGGGRGARGGAVYGVGVWTVMYGGLLPRSGLYPKPFDDVPARRLATLLGHVVYGGVLGALVERP